MDLVSELDRRLQNRPQRPMVVLSPSIHKESPAKDRTQQGTANRRLIKPLTLELSKKKKKPWWPSGCHLKAGKSGKKFWNTSVQTESVTYLFILVNQFSLLLVILVGQESAARLSPFVKGKKQSLQSLIIATSLTVLLKLPREVQKPTAAILLINLE